MVPWHMNYGDRRLGTNPVAEPGGGQGGRAAPPGALAKNTAPLVHTFVLSPSSPDLALTIYRWLYIHIQYKSLTESRSETVYGSWVG